MGDIITESGMDFIAEIIVRVINHSMAIKYKLAVAANGETAAKRSITVS